MINDVLNGEIDKYSMLINKYHDELFQYIYNIANDYSKTNQMLEDIFIKTHDQFDRFDASVASYRIWMYRVTSKYIIKQFASNQRISIANIVIDDLPENTLLLSMKKRLSAKQYRVLSLCYFSSLSINEISKSLGYTEKTILKYVKHFLLIDEHNETQCVKRNRFIDEEVLFDFRNQLTSNVMNHLYESRHKKK